MMSKHFLTELFGLGPKKAQNRQNKTGGNTMKNPYPFDADKAVEIVLYLANRINNPTRSRIGALLWFADKAHLHQHGRLTCNDEYVSTETGPEPRRITEALWSGATSDQDVKKIREALRNKLRNALQNAPGGPNDPLDPLQDGDAAEFSDSDQDHLDQAIQEFGALTDPELAIRVQQEEAWIGTIPGKNITLEAMTTGAPNREALLADLRDPFPGSAGINM